MNSDSLPTDSSGLAGRVLIAMPGMQDPRFAQSVVFLCDHSDKGAMGLIVNKPNRDVRLEDMLEQLSVETKGVTLGNQVYFGGPVEMGRGFVLHSPDYESAVTTLDVLPDVFMTATLDILEDIGAGRGPEKWMMALGYSGWGPGQLEAEIAQNSWLITDGSSSLVLECPDSEKWQAALKTLGAAALTLSSEGGRA